jgi:hypothetical protein
MAKPLHNGCIASCLVTTALLASCAGRAPQPVAVTSPMDTIATCAFMQGEIAANQHKITQIEGQKTGKVVQNVAAGVAGLFIWPLWFAMDLRGVNATEIKALEARNGYLLTAINSGQCQHPPQETAAS